MLAWPGSEREASHDFVFFCFDQCLTNVFNLSQNHHFVAGLSYASIKVKEKAVAAAKADLLRRVTNISIPYGDFKKHINVLLKHKWQSQWSEAFNNKLQ